MIRRLDSVRRTKTMLDDGAEVKTKKIKRIVRPEGARPKRKKGPSDD